MVLDIWPDEQADGSLEFSEDDLKLLRIAFGRRTPAED